MLLISSVSGNSRVNRESSHFSYFLSRVPYRDYSETGTDLLPCPCLCGLPPPTCGSLPGVHIYSAHVCSWCLSLTSIDYLHNLYLLSPPLFHHSPSCLSLLLSSSIFFFSLPFLSLSSPLLPPSFPPLSSPPSLLPSPLSPSLPSSLLSPSPLP